eukprot:GHVN01071121.1.p1 GENE.GHVN01071121.1~~GHVN01071121.1.p1  ORF type:complete len:119 (+),score=6.01 GHVN01071121.1:274-630(+)
MSNSAAKRSQRVAGETPEIVVDFSQGLPEARRRSTTYLRYYLRLHLGLWPRRLATPEHLLSFMMIYMRTFIFVYWCEVSRTNTMASNGEKKVFVLAMNCHFTRFAQARVLDEVSAEVS